MTRQLGLILQGRDLAHLEVRVLLLVDLEYFNEFSSDGGDGIDTLLALDIIFTFGRLIGYLLLTPLVILLEVHARPVEVVLRHSLVRLRDIKLQLLLSTAEDVSGSFARTFEATA